MNATEIAIAPAITATMIAQYAVDALLEELRLTPKPGLVDLDNNGCHHDLNVQMMTASAHSLFDTFHDMALAAQDKEPSRALREQLAAIGRYGEQEMLDVTGNVNTHKGAIWCVGLLTAAASMLINNTVDFSYHDMLTAAGRIASYEDRHIPQKTTNGDGIRKKYNILSAREEAQSGFPSLKHAAIPTWEKYAYESTDVQHLNVLLSLMAVVDDTCILHRSDMKVLRKIQRNAGLIVESGGLSANLNWLNYMGLSQFIADNWVSPGGSADLLSATIFIKKIMSHFKKSNYGIIFI